MNDLQSHSKSILLEESIANIIKISKSLAASLRVKFAQSQLTLPHWAVAAIAPALRIWSQLHFVSKTLLILSACVVVVFLFASFS